MHYVYMDNYRGFREVLIPIKQLTILVGENSTGKSSFLKLLYSMTAREFWYSTGNPFPTEADLGGYDDIVSASAADRSYFRVGIITCEPDESGSIECSFRIHTYYNDDGAPAVARTMVYKNGRITTIVFDESEIKYRIKSTTEMHDPDAIDSTIKAIINNELEDMADYETLPVPRSIPLPIILSIIDSLKNEKKMEPSDLFTDPPFWAEVSWIAPIRTKPMRYYGGINTSYSPEGEHAPYVLRRAYSDKSKSEVFRRKLVDFGHASGLYDAIKPHSYDDTPQSPFEILIKFMGVELNINSVGYGVSQVLPLLVEFFSGEPGSRYAVQQPEVHLHPRAQAALGDIITNLAKEEQKWFIIETHSDYLIDRCRHMISKMENPINAQVVFFQREDYGNTAAMLQIGPDGRYPSEQPMEFRSFFIKEEMRLLEI